MEKYMAWAIWILGAYLVGSVPFGYLIGRMRGVDVRTVGSKNIGATNVYRTVGKGWGLLAFLCDFLKGLLPTLAARLLFPEMHNLALAVGVSCVVGHTLTCFMKFKGGKGVATAFGMLVALVPALVGVAFLIFVVTVLISHYISLGSCLAAAFIAIAIWFYPEGLALKIVITRECLVLQVPLAGLAIKIVLTLLGAFVIYKHKSNIDRLRRGCENKIY